MKRIGLALCAALAAGALGWVVLAAPPLPGAIFTTTVDGTIVNENVRYEAKEDVYLDGGPGPQAPAKAAGLPAGDYYFQVTDPSGKDLLSTDHISCRQSRVNAFGVIEFVYPGMNFVKVKGTWETTACQHNQGVDVDHAELGAITVQLVPYDDTPNPGGVYKAWVTRVEDYAGASDCVVGENGKCNVNGENWQPGNIHGFIPSKSKTDNYKVRKKGKPFDSPLITVRKFEDTNGNGLFDATEPEIGVTKLIDGGGWPVDVTDPTLVTNEVFTPEIVLAPESGLYVFNEAILSGWSQTAAFLDGTAVTPLSPTVNVIVEGTSGETHEVLYGNFQCFAVTGSKFNDLDGNGQLDAGETGIAGWTITLLRNGEPFDSTTTGADGSYSFTVCEGGVYQVVEEDREGWAHTSPSQSDSFDGTSGIGRGPFDFLNFQCFDVSGVKYNDLNGNGTVDAGEPGIAGWTITLLQNGSVFATTTTGADGSYSFTVCEGGNYTVQEELRPDEWTPTSPTSVDLGAAVSGTSHTADFLNFACFDVTVTKFYDANKDGVEDGANECRLEDWTFTLEDGTTITLVTGSDGTASTHVCDPGAYSVVEEDRSGWLHTTASTIDFNAVSGSDVSLEFGNVQPFVGGLTIGYWKTHTGCQNDGTPVDPIFSPTGVRCSAETIVGGPILLGLQSVDNAQEAFAVFDGANCSDTCETMLRAQLLGAKLNVRTFPGFEDALLPSGQTVGEAIMAADAALISGLGSFTDLAGDLDEANNNHDGTTLVVDFCAQ